MDSINCQQANSIDLVDYLASMFFLPEYKTRREEYWYKSPFREEKKPSFHVNRKMNKWYDHGGTSRGGTVINFVKEYYGVTVQEALQRLAPYYKGIRAAQPTVKSATGHKQEYKEAAIRILSVRGIQHPALLRYLEQRCIPFAIANRFCKEVDFELYTRRYTAIGLRNKSGGYELRNAHFKGSSSPKDYTFFDQAQTELAVLEGQFSFISLVRFMEARTTQPVNFLILNSLSFLSGARLLMEKHSRVYLFLDRNPAGIKATSEALKWGPDKFIDCSALYAHCDDPNTLLIKICQSKSTTL